MSKSGRATGFLWPLYEYLAMFFGLGALAVICLIWLPFAMLLNPLLPRRLGTPLGRQAIRWGMRLYLAILHTCCACRFDLSALDQLRDEGPLILVANHPSLLDAPMILSRLPRAVCIMKASLLDNILFGSAARLAGYIANNSALKMITGAREELHAGAHLLLFPEGTRTRNAPIDTCMPTTGLIAGRAKVPVQTLLIEFSTPYLGKAWPLFQRPTLPLHCRVRLGRRFPAPSNVAAFTSELEAYFRSELSSSPLSTAVA
jgi:1-acyl-sn-glycerol-3-phosphate acyltransferase